MEYTHCSPSLNFADLPTPGKGKSEDPKNSEIQFLPDQTPFPLRELDTNPTPLSKCGLTRRKTMSFFFFFFSTILTEKAWSIKDLVYIFFIIIFIYLKLTNYMYHKLQIAIMTTYCAMASNITIYFTYLHQVLLTYIRKTNKLK